MDDWHPTKAIVHVYLHGGFWYVPTVMKRPNGLWVEFPPVSKIGEKDLPRLVEAIQDAQKASGKITETAKGWNGEAGSVWNLSRRIFYIYWLDNGKIKTFPVQKKPDNIDPETGVVEPGGWGPVKEKEKIFDAGTPLGIIIELMVSSE